jgi:hypothetical protein
MTAKDKQPTVVYVPTPTPRGSYHDKRKTFPPTAPNWGKMHSGSGTQYSPKLGQDVFDQAKGD